ncbi:MAG TPA: 23S rRNA (guanosine(2251)-2'-O)-methyltransferase RlmB [Desulfobulbaceae bacterium]|nr:23S rRNA (guanosine(2251)-2'-O)-methyltransferase RlmB [Desulfobulbaceae bacterium]
MKKQEKGGRDQGEKRIRLSEDLLWGIHPIFEGLEKEPERFTEIILQKDKRGGKIEEIVDMARRHGIKVSFTDFLRLAGEGAAQVRHQGIVARISEQPLIAFDDLVAKMKSRIDSGEKVRLMVCDCLQDPHNLGAIIRSSLASGAAGVIATRERSAPMGGTAAKASAGAMSHIDICQVTNLVTALKELKAAGFWIFGAVKDADARSLYDTDLAVPACLVVGSEGKGIRPLVKKECDILISIPMTGTLDSLNSSVAAAVILFEAMRQTLANR